MAVAYNLSNLPDPYAIEELDYKVILDAILADFKLRNPSYTNTVLGDPVYTMAHVATVREQHLRERVNEAVRACMVSHAKGTDLDNLAANFNVFRLIVQAADLSADPPKPQILETDTEVREKILLAWEQLAPGSPGWYKNHVLHADIRSDQSRDESDIFDAYAKEGPIPGTVQLWVQSRSNDGVPSDALIQTIETYMSDSSRRMLNDTLSVHKVVPVTYNITADLAIASGPLANDIITLVQKQVNDFCEATNRIGRSIPLSSIYAVLNQSYVESVNLIAPSANVQLNALTTKGLDVQIPHCGKITLREA